MAVLLERGSDITGTAPFSDARAVPEACLPCRYVDTCAGGCAGRRRLLRQPETPDPYCPVIRGDVRPLAITTVGSREMAKLESACTTIVRARR